MVRDVPGMTFRRGSRVAKARRAAQPELPLLHRGEVRLPSRHVRRRVRRREARPACLRSVAEIRGARALAREHRRGDARGARRRDRVPGTAGPVAVGRLPSLAKRIRLGGHLEPRGGDEPRVARHRGTTRQGLACLSISGVTRCVSDASSERKKGRVRGNAVARVPGTARTLRIRFGGYWYGRFGSSMRQPGRSILMLGIKTRFRERRHICRVVTSPRSRLRR